jgi:(p)ppGpp synthase/HD superfamily hydrolase
MMFFKESLADIVANTAHTAVGQMRKYTHEPYIVHPREVAEIVRAYGGDTIQIQAALLHDVVEDTSITVEFIADMFGKEVATMVDWLTDVSNPYDGNRDTRKAMDREHLSRAPRDAQFVKVADMISNSKSIGDHAAGFAKIYMKEKELLLEAMTKIHGTDIYNAAMKLIEEYNDVGVPYEPTTQEK